MSSAAEIPALPTTDDIDPKTGKNYTQSQLKKLKKKIAAQKKKLAKGPQESARAAKQEADRVAKLEEAKAIVLTEDPSLPAAVRASVGQIQTAAWQGKRVKLFGWVQNLRVQKTRTFLFVRDGTGGAHGALQCMLQGDLAKTFDAVTLHREAAVAVYGVAVADERAEGGVELHADYWELVGASTAEIDNKVGIQAVKRVLHAGVESDDTAAASAAAADAGKAHGSTYTPQGSEVKLLFDQRHLVLRGSEETQIVLKVRSMVTQCFRDHFFAKDFYEVTPPSLVQTNCEGGSSLFKLDYFGEPALLTQSSQLYLESVMPALGNVFCVAPSFRAEKSHTRRHLCEFMHVEGEMPFISFEDLLTYCEDLIVDVSERAMARCPDLIHRLNPTFKPPTRPIRRMDYTEAIEFCNANGIKNPETGEAFKVGEDITEAPERELVDMIGEPIFLCRFPFHMKSFYMSRCPENSYLTESVDLLMPGVGEIIGGSCRETSEDKLMAACKEFDLSPDAVRESYYWYVDVRKFGTCPHGGFGLGLERFICWLLDINHIRNVPLFPRYAGRCLP